jgi:hypothetical protein
LFLLEYNIIISKWVYRGKKLAAQKSRVKYLSFQGGDSRPLALLYAYNTVLCIDPDPYLTPPTGHHPTITCQRGRTFDKAVMTNLVSVRTEQFPDEDPKVRHDDLLWRSPTALG